MMFFLKNIAYQIFKSFFIISKSCLVLRPAGSSSDGCGNQHTLLGCLVKPTQSRAHFSALCDVVPKTRSQRGGWRTKTGLFHQDPGVGITQDVYVCLYMCGTACSVSPVFIEM